MAVPVPDLDDRAWADLVDEARTIIPTACPAWTNHNPSDPGIALVELLAWLTEALVFQVGARPEALTRAALALLDVGPDHPDDPHPEPPADLAEAVRETLRRLRSPFRAVTLRDHEELVATRFTDRIRLVRCGLSEEPGSAVVDVLVVPSDADDPTLHDDVAAFLEPRRLLTTRIAVRAPSPVEVLVRADVALASDAAALDRADAERRLRALLDPAGPGLPARDLGRTLHASEVYAALAAAPGVDHVEHVRFERFGDEVRGEAVRAADDELMTLLTPELTVYDQLGRVLT